ncbi:ISAs1 family transposase [uncultured Thiocystis sp.]|uniref:ISAs1 family transposase n=1 Tax=uncultured Thiocystis sp. TaxID=1202134 RepID=UPI0034470821
MRLAPDSKSPASAGLFRFRDRLLGRQFAPFANGIPSHDGIASVIWCLNPKTFQACFVSWTRAIGEATDGEVVAIDGKTARGSRDRRRGQAALHMVSAWGGRNRLVL